MTVHIKTRENLLFRVFIYYQSFYSIVGRLKSEQVAEECAD